MLVLALPREVKANETECSIEVCGHGEVEARFRSGWRDAGGDAQAEEYFIQVVIPCESTWDATVISENGLYYGLVQFLWSTWNQVAGMTGLWDWADPYSQGYNAATWLRITSLGQWGCG